MLIDAHTHIFAPEQAAQRDAICAADRTFAEMYADPNAKLADAPRLLAALDRAGIDRAVAAGFAFARARDIAAQNEYLLGSAKESGRIIPLATINLSLAGWREEANRALLSGARGFGELRPHNQGWDPLGAEARVLCSLAREAGVVLLWHVSEDLGHSYPGKRGGISPAELARLAGAFPGLRMVAAHLGGGLPFFLHMPEVRSAIEHVYFDTAAQPLLYDDASVTQLVALAGPNRVLFGSDYPLLSPMRQLRRIKALLPGGIAEAVCGGNADTLFSEVLREQ